MRRTAPGSIGEANLHRHASLHDPPTGLGELQAGDDALEHHAAAQAVG